MVPVLLAFLVGAARALPQDGGGADQAGGAQETATTFLEELARQGLAVDVEARAVHVPGVLLRDQPSPEYPIEYSLVTEEGFIHEAFAMLKCKPSTLNACLLWIGLEPGRSRQVVLKEPLPPEEDLRLGLEDPYRVIPPAGERVFCYVRWTDEQGFEQVHALEDLMWDVRNRQPLPLRGYVYTGSRFVEHQFGLERRTVFIADYEGNIATLYPDRGAAENCLFDVYSADAEPYRFSDVNPQRVPPTGTPLTFIFSPVHRDGIRPPDPEPPPDQDLLPAAAELAARSRNPYLVEADPVLLERIGARTGTELAGMLRRGRDPLREVAAGLLGAAQAHAHRERLRDVLRTDRSADTRLSAAYALVELGGRAAADAFLEALGDRWWEARKDARFGLCLLTGVDLGFDEAAWRTWLDEHLPAPEPGR